MNDPGPELNKMQDRARNKHIALSVCMELTHRCNLHCKMCYLDVSSVDHRSPEELTGMEIADLLDELAVSGTLFLKFTGGEVFLRGDFLHIVSLARAKGFACYIKTNGTLITPEKARLLGELTPVRVDISLLGASPLTHDGITGVPGSFEAAVQALRYLRDCSVRTAVSTTLLKENLHEFAAISTIGEQVGAIQTNRSVLIAPMTTGDRTALLASRLTPEELRSYLACSVQPESDQHVAGQWHDRRGRMCNAGRSYCVISPSGDVKLCVVFPQSFGNIRCEPFTKIWQDDPGLKMLRSLDPSRGLTSCGSCAVRHDCRLPHSHCTGYLLGGRVGPSIESCRLARTKQ